MKTGCLLGRVLFLVFFATVLGVIAYSQDIKVKRDPQNSTERVEGRAGAGSIKSRDSIEIAADTLNVLYAFTGVTDDGMQGSLDRRKATSVHCTNIGDTDAEVEVQVFQFAGLYVYAGSATIPPMSTATYSTQNTTVFFEDVILGGSSGTPPINQGFGRVLSSHENVICTAQVLDSLNYPPYFVTGLPIYGPSGTRGRVVVIPLGD